MEASVKRRKNKKKINDKRNKKKEKKEKKEEERRRKMKKEKGNRGTEAQYEVFVFSWVFVWCLWFFVVFFEEGRQDVLWDCFGSHVWFSCRM